MKITKLEAVIIVTEVKNPMKDALHTYDAGTRVVTKIHTDEGIIGYGSSFFGRGKASGAILKLMLESELGPHLIGEDPHFTRQIRKKLWSIADYHGAEGFSHFAISAIDIALWDIIGKKANLPTAKVLGAVRDRIPAYCMAGWYVDTEKEYVAKCIETVEEGFKAIKLKVGKYSLENDIERIKLAQREVGPDIKIMVDANQGFDEKEALRRGRAYEQLGVRWFEEPLIPQHKESSARLAHALDIPIAIGENFYSKFQFYDAVQAGAASIYQPDNRRAGGPTEWLEIGAITDVAGHHIASHGGGPANVNMLCVLPNAIFLESGSLKKEDGLLKTRLTMVDGEVLLPDVPGMGTEVDEEYVEKYRVD
ncbi:MULTISPECIES: mandelate racemase/muconate lactonizing enzyme family protein [Paenibacillus]|uniref:Mandelate racemase/muconate lactonizing enzyme family protein n=1 Tax=Paenibacillus radicis (ex Xue et al. 2023) TaxID=2972489 RepID=A0ABT1YQU2_9BACL|nr:mandelate racemase/muconate lactonizing enzyme family protein [Paenibacillus radicis (ex Xue et al. 2023)]MCR8635543.1 mandelate racemase/muconate lactonizing enzyme family protein [Paenibacillus radicis (ex Xue et al. 2023)]